MLQRATVDGDSRVALLGASFDCSAATMERISSIRRHARIAHCLNSSIDCVSARVFSTASICELRAASSACSSSSSDWLEPTALSIFFARIVIPKYGCTFVTTIRGVIMNPNAPSLDWGLASPQKRCQRRPTTLRTDRSLQGAQFRSASRARLIGDGRTSNENAPDRVLAFIATANARPLPGLAPPLPEKPCPYHRRP
ncbi:hypothetical protein ACVI1L_001311 [Bradyrhizobium sp. USDA 4516]